MPLPRILSLAIAAFILGAASLQAAPEVATLRAQLDLATTAHDDLSRIELLRRILDADPADAKSHQLLVELWLKVQDYDLAESTLQAWPGAPAELVALTRAQILRNRDQDVPGAVRVLQAYLATSPKDPIALEALVQCLLTTDDRATLLATLDQFIAVQRDVPNLFRRANVKLLLGDYQGALADAKAAQALEPDSEVVKSGMPTFERLEETLQALPPLDAAIAKDPKNIAALLDRAWWLRYGGLNARSLADGEAALAIDPESVMARIVKARALFLLGKLKAIDALTAESIDVNKPHPLETAQAILACDLALAKNPKDAAQLRKRAFSLNEAAQYLLAQKDAEAALAIDPKAAAAALEGLYAGTMLGENPAALYRRIEEMKPTKTQLATAAGYIADYYFAQTNYPLALEFADRALALHETEHLLRIKGATLQRLNRTDEANAVIRRADAIHKE